jgi:uncharacterized protein YndB with AHSA1/START domain
MSSHGTYATIDGTPAVRFERRLDHPIDAVWHAITDPEELAHWFPSGVAAELRVGGAMRFTFSPELELDGEVLALEPPHRFAFRWGTDVLRFELAEAAGGTRLVLEHLLYDEGGPAAARSAAGWHLCLDALARRLAGDQPGPAPAGMSEDWRARYDEYLAAGVPGGAAIPGA